MVIVPLRNEAPVFGATEKSTVPFPDPPCTPVIMMKLALLIAVQLQPCPVETETVPVPPPDPKAWLVGDIENVQPWPAWFTVCTLPPTITFPTREFVL
jgi:hypothetical protein